MSSRQQFVATLEALLAADDRLFLILGDIGVFGFRNAFARHPGRVLNIGILEQATVSFAAGLAAEGFIPVFHSIAPFVVERALEQLKVDFCYQQLPIKLVSVGASFDYASLGCTHHCPEDVAVLLALPGMQVVTPGNPREFDLLFRASYANASPTYYRLAERSHSLPLPVEFGRATVVRQGKAATVVAVGPMLEPLLQAAEGFDLTILYYATVAPFDRDTLAAMASGPVICLEPFYQGTLAGEIAAALGARTFRLVHHGVPREFLTKYGKIGEHEQACGLDAAGVRRCLQEALRG